MVWKNAGINFRELEKTGRCGEIVEIAENNL